MNKWVVAVSSFGAFWLFGCSSTAYEPTSANMDIRTAQDQVRTLLTAGAAYVIWDLEEARVSDVRFRSDGIGLLVQKSAGPQTMEACYYSGIGNIKVTHVPLGRSRMW